MKLFTAATYLLLATRLKMETYGFVGTGECRNSNDEGYPNVFGPLLNSASNSLAADCSAWCLQHPSGVIGFHLISPAGTGGVYYACECLYDGALPVPIPTRNPPHYGTSQGLHGKGPIVSLHRLPGDSNDCYSYAADYNYVGDGACSDSNGSGYSNVQLSFYGNLDSLFADCDGWCQQRPTGVVGFELHDKGVLNVALCVCLYDSALPDPIPARTPPRITQLDKNDTGKGHITSFIPNSSKKCYSYTDIITHAPVTVTPTTHSPSTLSPSSHAPVATQAPTTLSPTSVSPTSHSPSSVSPTSHAPVATAAPTTHMPTSLKPTSHSPTTTVAAGTNKPSTHAPSSLAPSSHAPVATLAPTTHSPSTVSPTSHSPSTGIPTSHSPVATQEPTTHSPTTTSPTSHSPVSISPTSHAPVTQSKSAKNAKSSKGTGTGTKSSKNSKKI